MAKKQNIVAPKVDPAREELKKWLEETCQKLHKYFLLDFSNLKINFCPEDRGDGDDNRYIFTVLYNRNYRMICLQVFPLAVEMFKGGVREELTDGLVHELSHVHTMPLAEAAQNRFISQKEIMGLNEELTEILAQYIRKNIKLENHKDGLQINADKLRIINN